MNATALVISDISIRQDAEGRFCLNDLHIAAGKNNKHRPSLWLENQQAKDLITEIDLIAGIPAIKIIKGHRATGTYVVRELVYAYAMWISAKFHLQVIRAYDAMVMAERAGNSGLLTEGDLAMLHKFCEETSHLCRIGEEMKPVLDALASIALMNVPGRLHNLNIIVPHFRNRFGVSMEQAAKKYDLLLKSSR